MWQHAETMSVAIGLILLAVGYTGWYRDQDRLNDGASAALFFGSLLAGVPLAIAAVVHRFGSEISLPDELGLATVSTLLLISGVICRLRSTTLVGGGLLVLHLGMLLVSVGMQAELA